MKEPLSRSQARRYEIMSHRDPKTGLFVPGTDPADETIKVADIQDHVARVSARIAQEAIKKYRKKLQERQRNKGRRQSRQKNRR